jgi:hypothetical protein
MTDMWVGALLVATTIFTIGVGIHRMTRPKPHEHYNPHMFGPGARMLEGFVCRYDGCSVVWLDREDYKGWADQLPVPDPMSVVDRSWQELQKEIADTRDFLNAPLEEDFKELEETVQERETRLAHIAIVKANHERWTTNPIRPDLPDTWPALQRHLAETENHSDVSDEERRRESLFNTDIPL